MTQPTVGRVVWFWPSADEQLALPRSGQPLAAHVAAVSEDGSTVNLQVIDANGHAHARQDVPFFEGGHPGGQSYADWMPYQRAQHAKQESVAVAHGFAGTLVADYIAGRPPLSDSAQNQPTSPAIPWYATEQETGVGGVIDSVRSAEADEPEGQPAEESAKASDPASPDDASAS